MKRNDVAAYVRVSTPAQNFGLQKNDIERIARARGDTVQLWIREKGSGDKARPELAQLLELARKGQVRRIYAWALDRISREGIRPTLQLVQELKAWGCELVTVREAFDFSNEMVVAAVSWAAQFELARLRERISAARRHKEERGEHWGRPRTAGAVTVEKIRKLAAEGVSIREIAQHVQVKRGTVANVLSKKGPYAGGAKAPRKR